MKLILGLADLHCGSHYALWHPRFTRTDPKTGEPMIYTMSGASDKLFTHWKKCVAYAKEHQEDLIAIVLNGDLVEGSNPAEGGETLYTPDVGVQADCVVKLVDMLPNVPVYISMGSRYHGVQRLRVEQYIANAVKQQAIFRTDMLVDLAGIRMYVSHTLPTSNTTWQYRTTGLARDLLLMALNEAKSRYGKVHLVNHAHAHYFVEASFPSSMGVITPCWKGRDEYSVKKDIVTPPDNGWLGIWVDETNPKRIMIDRTGIVSVVPPCDVIQGWQP